MKKLKLYGVEVAIGKTITAPNNEVVLKYLSDAKKGKILYEKTVRKNNKY